MNNQLGKAAVFVGRMYAQRNEQMVCLVAKGLSLSWINEKRCRDLMGKGWDRFVQSPIDSLVRMKISEISFQNGGKYSNGIDKPEGTFHAWIDELLFEETKLLFTTAGIKVA